MTLSPRQQALKEAARNLVAAVGGGEAAANFTRVSQQRLSEYGNLSSPLFMPIDVAADLEAVTKGQPGAPHVSRVLSKFAGLGMAPLPGAKPVGITWFEHIARLSKEIGELATKLAAAASNGDDVTALEVRRLELLREVRDVIQAAVDLEAALVAVAEETG